MDEELGQEQQMVTAAPDVTVLARASGDEFVFLGCDGWSAFRKSPSPPSRTSVSETN